MGEIFAFPSRASRLLSPDHTEVIDELLYWKDFCDDWLQLVNVEVPHVKKMVAKSFANTPVFNDFAEKLSFEAFKRVPDDLIANLRTGNSIRQTLMAENMIKSVRTVVHRCQENKRVSRVRAWLTVLQRKVVTGRFKYKTVDFRRQVIKGVLKKRLPRSWFVPPKRNGPGRLNFRDIVSTSRTLTFPSYNAESQRVQYGEIFLLRELLRNNLWWACASAWLCLGLVPGTLFRRKGTRRWFFSVNTKTLVNVLSWPALKVEHDGSDFYGWPVNIRPNELVFTSVFDLACFEVLDIEWKGGCV